MASTILNQLKVKKSPKKQQEIKVKINEQPSSIISRAQPVVYVKATNDDDIPKKPIDELKDTTTTTQTQPQIDTDYTKKQSLIIKDLTRDNKGFDLQSFRRSIMTEITDTMNNSSTEPVVLYPSPSLPPSPIHMLPPPPIKKKTIVRTIKKKTLVPTTLTPTPSPSPTPAPISIPITIGTEVKEKTPRTVKITRKIKIKAPPPALSIVPEEDQPIVTRVTPVISSKVGQDSIVVDFADRIRDYKYKLKTEPSYFMNNRKKFIEFITNVFTKKYKRELTEVKQASCDSTDDDSVAGFNPMAHQKIVRDYINSYSPYRGALLYHGLGSGKTCSSIIIAEGMKTEKEVMILTPASLRTNYREELKKCGDLLYVKNQFWEFIDVKSNPDYIQILSTLLSIPIDMIKQKGGAWLVNMNKPSNYSTLNSSEKKSLDDQIDKMISTKYQFISYNGLRKQNIKELTRNFTINPFDNKVIIIDEAHNFVSKIVNKINTKKSDVMSIQLYEYLMEAVNVKIVLLSGTPIINYPNEIAVLFNILRGKIKTWTLDLDIKSKNRNTPSTEYFKSIFKSTTLGGNISDYIEYTSAKNLVITRNPYGFVNKTEKDEYAGVRISDNDRGIMTDDEFVKKITGLLEKNDIMIKGMKIDKHKLLPDKLDDFNKYFIENNEFSNSEMFKRRILGLTSYFRSAQESLMPAYTKKNNFHIVNIPMSDFQFAEYDKARSIERKEEKQTRRGNNPEDIYSENMTSTYRVYSRSFCNFVFPSPEIKRPMLDKSIKVNEDELDVASQEEKLDNPDGQYEADDLVAEVGESKGDAADTSSSSSSSSLELKRRKYAEDVLKSLELLEKNKERFLSKDNLGNLSPKFLSMLNNISNENNVGLHLIYSQFRTLEGIGILKLVLEANGFAQLKIKPDGKSSWKLDVKDEDLEKPKFALYTGKESTKEKEIVRNIFNGNFRYVPDSLMKELTNMSQLTKQSNNNMYGAFVKILMISSSGSEGISLKNVRYVHITEPYWHAVRTEQVIGRANRICSHKDLPKELRTVDVFLYLMNITDDQKKKSYELVANDTSRIDGKSTVSTDQTLYEIASIKEEISQSILRAVKESAFDCRIHSTSSSDENLKCFTFGIKSSSASFASTPSIENEIKDDAVIINREAVELKTKILKIGDKEYAYDIVTQNVYDKVSIINKNPLLVGKLVKEGTGFKLQMD